jgi:RNA polymerase sigma factor (sigma-70 family)
LADEPAPGALGRLDGLRVSDAVVIERSWQDAEAFGELFERHADELHRYAGRRVGVEVADDLLGETFAIAFQHRVQYDVSRPDARPWLYGIATNLLNRHRRAEARRLRAMSRTVEPAAVDPIAEQVQAKVGAQAARAQLLAALCRLSAQHRDVVLLTAWAELDYEEIAEALGIPLGTVRSRLHRARRELQQAMAVHLSGDE